MSVKYLLGLDNGGTMTKAAIFDDVGREIAIASRNTPLNTPQVGWNERDMEALWKANVECICEVIQKSGIDGRQIIGIGCTGHGKGLYLWGKDQKPAYSGIASTDRRAEEIVARWLEDGTEEAVRESVIQPILACQPVALLRWLKENNPEVLEKTQWVFECKDYIRFRLTGKAMAEETDYSGTCLMNMKTRRFDRELLAAFDLEEILPCLPPLCNAWDICGNVTEQVAEMTGLASGTPVCGGMFDIDACAVAMGVIEPSQLCMITGTWSINEYPAKDYVAAESGTHNSIFCIPGYYLIEESSPTSAGNLEWYLETCMKAEKIQSQVEGTSIYENVNAMVENLLPEDSNVVFLPFLYGSNTATHDAAFIGLSNSYSSADMLRAVFEGVVFSHRMHFERLLRFREKPKAIRMAGGAVNSRVWVQMFADILQCPIEVVSTKELGAQGCAMAAAVASGLYSTPEDALNHMLPSVSTVWPNAERKEIYDKKYARYITITERIGNI